MYNAYTGVFYPMNIKSTVTSYQTVYVRLLLYDISGYPPIMANVAVSNLTGTGIKDLREKIFTIASELKEMSGDLIIQCVP